jgi:hypothetical protein
VKDEPVVGVAAKGLGYDLLELRFDIVHALAGCQSRPVANPEDVRVDCEGLLPKSCIEDDVRGFAADSRERL